MQNQRIRIRLKAFDHRLIDQSTQEIVDTARRTGAQVKGPIPLPTDKERFTVLISPHVNKDARDQYEIRTHKRLLDIVEPPPGRQKRLYAVLPSYRGETLEQRLLRSPKITLKEGIDIGIKLAKAVYALNRLRIIHRDIKPENVMLLDDGGLKLLDLGVALLPGIQEPTPEGAPGTPSYMAPELFRGEGGDERSDVYALGVTLYRVFSAGHYPYGEVEPFSRPRFSRYTPLTHHRPDLPAWLDSSLARATEVTAATTNVLIEAGGSPKVLRRGNFQSVDLNNDRRVGGGVDLFRRLPTSRTVDSLLDYTSSASSPKQSTLHTVHRKVKNDLVGKLFANFKLYG